MSDFTTFLFSTPSFLTGAASVIDLGGTLVTYNQSRDSDAADLRALRADNEAVAVDAGAALQELIAHTR